MHSKMPDELVGYGVSRGVVAGPVAWMTPRPDLSAAPDWAGTGTPDERAEEARAALESVARQLENRADHADRAGAAILEAQAMMARDPALDAVIQRATEAGASAAAAISTAFAEFRDALLSAGPYLAERVADIDDLRERSLAVVLGIPIAGVPQPGHPYVLVARDLAPADTAVLNPRDVLGIITEQGGPSSHTAILAKSLGIPAVVAVNDAGTLREGDRVLIDGLQGTVLVEPSADVVAHALEAEDAERAREAQFAGPGHTSDGAPVRLLVNIGAVRDLEEAATTDCEGVGLFRTEFLFLDRASAPSFDEQRQAYLRVFEAFAGRRVVVRTLDAGADKPLGFVDHGHEPNPALGRRGVRTADFAPELLDLQLRAIGAAAAESDADVWVMAPMVSLPSEARKFVDLARGHGLGRVGSMIEVPAAAIRADRILQHCDFVSLGTNDLAQYTFAADRMLGKLGHLLDPWQPGLLEMVRIAAVAGQETSKPVGVCGEAASDPELALVLVGLGVRSLSMAPSLVPAVRSALAGHSLTECISMAEAALRADDATEARAAVKSMMVEHAP